MADRYVTPCELPTPHEREILDILIEECAEVIKRATKLLRFGRDEIQPGQEKTNAERLSNEIGDVQHMVDLLGDVGIVNHQHCLEGRQSKRQQLAKYMQTSKAGAA
jgi:hypothetical protein